MSDVLHGERWRVDEGDCLAWLRGLPDGFAQCCVTSPPYWGLRDYGEPGQLGLEPTPEEFVANMVAVFAEVRRVLRDDGVLWLNIGDSYARDPRRGVKFTGGNADIHDRQEIEGNRGPQVPPGLKEKDLCMIPARLALALQADGWYLRSDVIWYKPNPMPESVTDRPTSAHEHVFLLAKSERYFFDAFAVREESASVWNSAKGFTDTGKRGNAGHSFFTGEKTHHTGDQTGRNIRNVWEIPTQGTPEAHFATYPEALVEPCIKAGSSDRACSECGAAWERIVQRGNSGHHCRPGCGCHEKQRANGEQNWEDGWRDYGNYSSTAIDTGEFVPTCDCAADVTGSIVIDPFTGSGTTGRVALRLGRRFLGCELNPEYAAMSRRRIASYHVKPVRPRPADDDRQISMFDEETA